MRNPSNKGFTLVELLVVIVIIGILAGLLLPTIAKALRQGKNSTDINNLRQLWGMQTNYLAQFGGKSKLYPIETGGNFWMKLAQTTPPLLDPAMFDLFDCPFNAAPAAGSCDYRGPATDINTFGDGDPVGADKVGAHGQNEGGNVVRKSGDVAFYNETDSVWLQSAQKLMD